MYMYTVHCVLQVGSFIHRVEIEREREGGGEVGVSYARQYSVAVLTI